MEGVQLGWWGGTCFPGNTRIVGAWWNNLETETSADISIAIQFSMSWIPGMDRKRYVAANTDVSLKNDISYGND